MEQTAGIYIEHNTKGTPTFARIDLKKYGSELRDFFFSQGIEITNVSTNKALKEAHTKKLKTYESADALLTDLYS
ncbi:MAG: hypothetical protein LBN11_07770 [Tannerella sp.]|jgi:hypothetical protein|nr:hypothetical protein [Tannerella sp.]